MRSALRLKLPRPTVIKTPSPISELMWELPTPSGRKRRKSMPGPVQNLVKEAIPSPLNNSNSQPELKLNPRSLSVPADNQAYIPDP